MKPRSARRLARWVRRIAITAILLPAAVTYAVPYQWRDGQGRMVYSDLPPPPSTPSKHIIAGSQARGLPDTPPGSTQPGSAESAAGKAGDSGRATASAKAGDSGQANAGANADKANHAISATAPGQTTADREFAFRKRQAERADEEKKAAEAARRQTELAKACADSQGDIRTLESGRRIGRIGAGGEQQFISDTERSERLKDARKNVAERC